MPDADPPDNEISLVVDRARRQAVDGQVRASVLRRLVSLYGLDGLETETAVAQLAAEGLSVDGPLDQDDDEEVAPSGADLRSLEDAAPRRRAPLEQCVCEARALLATRRLGQVHRQRVLTANEEVGLASLARAGTVPLDASLPVAYRKTVKEGSEAAQAFDALVEHNIRLVWSIGRSYAGRGLDLEDVVSNGMFGLIRAVEMFDGTRGFKFSTYATWWVRQSITRGLANEAATIRLPVHLVDQVNRMRAVWSRLDSDTDGNATLSQVAKALDVPPSRVVWLLNISRGTYSLDKTLTSDGSQTLRDLIPDADDMEDSYHRTEARSAIQAVLADLTDRERQIMRLRYGLDSGEAMTLEEIGRLFNLTRERIRQIQDKTLKKLRHPRYASQLQTYYVAG